MAVTNFWNPNQTGYWRIASNWLAGVVPDASQDVAVNLINSAKLTIDNNAVVKSLNIASTGFRTGVVITQDASLTVSGLLTLGNLQTYLNIEGGTLSVGSLDNQGRISGAGLININNLSSSMQVIYNSGGLLKVQGAWDSAGFMIMNNTDVLELSSSVSGAKFHAIFANASTSGGKLIIDTPNSFAPFVISGNNSSGSSISGASLASLIELEGVSATGVQYDPMKSILTVYQSGGQDLSYRVMGSLTNLTPIYSSDGNGGSLIAFAPQFYDNTGGVLKMVTPEIYVGPVKGLVYQFISNIDNAVISAASVNSFIKLSSTNSIGKAVNGNGATHVIDGGVGSTFITGGTGHSGDTFFLDGRAPGVSWSTIADFNFGGDQATIWGFIKGVSAVNTNFSNPNGEGAAGYTGVTLHFDNLLPDGQFTGTNPNLNSITLSGHTLTELGFSSLQDLNNQIDHSKQNALGQWVVNDHMLIGQTQDLAGTHGYLWIH